LFYFSLLINFLNLAFSSSGCFFTHSKRLLGNGFLGLILSQSALFDRYAREIVDKMLLYNSITMAYKSLYIDGVKEEIFKYEGLAAFLPIPKNTLAIFF
jgi:hypothetical protein